MALSWNSQLVALLFEVEDPRVTSKPQQLHDIARIYQARIVRDFFEITRCSAWLCAAAHRICLKGTCHSVTRAGNGTWPRLTLDC